ncbi:MAG: hypothetical protein SGCHY_004368 [Lobulomycetales sp.]
MGAQERQARRRFKELDQRNSLQGRARALFSSPAVWVYLVLQVLGIYIGFGELVLILSIFYLIYTNLGARSPGEKSAYSVFNEGVESIDGDLKGEDIDNEIRHKTY